MASESGRIRIGETVLYHGRAVRGHGPRSWLPCRVVNILDRGEIRSPRIVLSVPGRTRPLVLPESVIFASRDVVYQPSLPGLA